MSCRTYCPGGCGRYRSCPDSTWWWICADHYKRVPKPLKRVLARLNRKIRRYGYTDELRARYVRCLRAMKKAAATRPPKEIEEWLV
jgi:hypothetical protein